MLCQHKEVLEQEVVGPALTRFDFVAKYQEFIGEFFCANKNHVLWHRDVTFIICGSSSGRCSIERTSEMFYFEVFYSQLLKIRTLFFTKNSVTSQKSADTIFDQCQELENLEG